MEEDTPPKRQKRRIIAHHHYIYYLILKRTITMTMRRLKIALKKMVRVRKKVVTMGRLSLVINKKLMRLRVRII